MKHSGVKLKRRDLESIATHGITPELTACAVKKNKAIASEPIQNSKRATKWNTVA
jgi:hypothetical protein